MRKPASDGPSGTPRREQGEQAVPGHLEALRRAEIEGVRRWFAPGQRVLEIGGGSGYQASVLGSWGCEVTSIDLADRAQSPRTYFPVIDYDGEHIPATAGSFDRVLSSNVLEHVQRLPALLAEVARVSAPGALGVHLMPSPSWRLWTSLAHYPYLALRLAGRARPFPGAAEVPSMSGVMARRGVLGLVRRALWAGPHGEYPSALAELYYFSPRRWIRLFGECGFELVEHSTNELFYTGVGLLPGLSIEERRRLAAWLGPSCHTYVVRAAGHDPARARR